MKFLFLLATLWGCGVESRVEKANDALRSGDWVSAESGYRWVLEREPDHVGALYGLGWVYLQDQDPLRAREYFKRCVRVAPEDYRGHKGLGSVALSQNLTSQAEQSFQDALNRAVTPSDKAAILNSIALLRSNSGKREEAIALLIQATELDPERGEYRFNLAENQHELDRHEEALRTVDQALSLQIEELRFRALLLVLRASILVSMTVDRLDPERCEETLPPIITYLDHAERALEQAEALKLEIPQLYKVRRQVYERRSRVTEKCSG